MVMKKLMPWLVGLLVATLLFGLLYAYTPFEYVGSDDTPILRSFMGFEGGEPATYSMLLHTGFAWMLHGLALLFPGMAWFSILSLFLLWFSCLVLVKSATACAINHRLPWWMGALAGTLFVAVYAPYIACRINFTTTGALVGAAAVAQLMSADYRRGTNGQILRGMLLSIVLLLCCYSMRQIGVLPPLAFWALAVALIGLTYFKPGRATLKKASEAAATEDGSVPKPDAPRAAPSRSPRPLLISLLVCALSFGLFAGVRAIEIKALDLGEFMQWQGARSRLMDNTNFELDYAETDPALLEELGWSQAELKLVANWFFIDSNVTTEALQLLYEAHAPSITTGERLAHIPLKLDAFLQDNIALRYALFFTLASALFALVALLWRRPRSPWLWLGIPAGLLLGAVLLAFLAFQGRMPMRAWMSACLPMAAFFLCLPFLCLEKTGASPKWGKPVLALVSVVGLIFAGLSLSEAVKNLYVPYDPEVEAKSTISEDLDLFALENEDMLIIYDLSLTNDRRLFPNTDEGIPGNVMFWGGYPARSPSWYNQLAAYDIDGHAFTAEDFLRENVLVAGTDSHPWESLLAYIEEDTGVEVSWDFYGEVGYVYFYELYEY